MIAKNSMRKRAQRAHPEGVCEKCGSSEDLQRHHTAMQDGSDDIKLLCRSCHKDLHVKQGDWAWGGHTKMSERIAGAYLFELQPRVPYPEREVKGFSAIQNRMNNPNFIDKTIGKIDAAAAKNKYAKYLWPSMKAIPGEQIADRIGSAVGKLAYYYHPTAPAHMAGRMVGNTGYKIGREIARRGAITDYALHKLAPGAAQKAYNIGLIKHASPQEAVGTAKGVVKDFVNAYKNLGSGAWQLIRKRLKLSEPYRFASSRPPRNNYMLARAISGLGKKAVSATQQAMHLSELEPYEIGDMLKLMR